MSEYYSLLLMPHWNQTPELYVFPAKFVPLWIVCQSLQDIPFSLERLTRTCCLHCSKVGKSTALVCHSVRLLLDLVILTLALASGVPGYRTMCAYCTVPKSPRSAIFNFSCPTSSLDVLLNMEILLHLFLARICVLTLMHRRRTSTFHPGG
jgi:hypothetical protein